MSLRVGTLSAILELDSTPFDRGMAGTSGTAQQAGQAAGQSFGQRMAGGVRDAMGNVMQTVNTTVTAGATVAGGLLATSLVKGFGRLTTIQDATSALTVALGDAAAAGSLLDEVLSVVSGTPFNLDQFAAGAQQMVGFGIEAEKIPTYLTAIGEASATQGARANEFADRLMTVFGQIQAQTQISLADVWRISDTGVNALAILGNHFGVAANEMKSMISGGAVPAGEALDALAQGILHGSTGINGATVALAGTMEQLRKNLSGAVAGIVPAMARIGAALIEPWTPTLIAGANSYVDLLDLIGERAGALSTRLASADGVTRFAAGLADLPDVAGQAMDSLSGLGPIAVGASGALAALGLGGVRGLLGPLGMLVPGINPVVAGLVAMAVASPEARQELGQLASDGLPLARQALDALAPLLTAVSSSLGDVLPAAVRAGGAALLAAAEAGVALLEVASPLGVALLGVATPALVTGLNALASVLGVVADAVESNETAVRLLVTAYAAWRIASLLPAAGALSASLDRIAISAYDAAGAIHSSRWATGFRQIGTGLRDIGGAGVGAFTHIDNYTGRATRGVNSLRSGVRNLGASLSGLVSPTLVLMAGVAGVAEEMASARRNADALVDANRNVADSYDRAGLMGSIQDTRRELERQLQTFDSYGGVWDTIKGGVEAVLPGVTSGIYENAKAVDALQGSLDELEGQQARLDQTARTLAANLGISEAAAARLMRELDIDLESTSLPEILRLVNQEVDRLAGANPQTDAIVGALETIGDEASSATDNVEAFGDALDAVFAPAKGLFDATTDYAKGFWDLAEAVTSGADGWNAWTTEGANARAALSGFLDDAKELAEAEVLKGITDGLSWSDAAQLGVDRLEEARQKIVDLGVDAGRSRGEMEDLLAELDFDERSFEFFVAMLGADEAQAKAEELRREVEELGGEHRVGVTADTGDALQSMGDVQRILTDLIVSTNTPLSMRLNNEDPVGKMAALEEWIERLAESNPVIKAWWDNTDPDEKQQQLNAYIEWYQGADLTAQAYLDTVGARLGFDDLTRWAQFYESLDPSTQADLVHRPAMVNFSMLQAAAIAWRTANPKTTAHVDVAEARRRLDALANERRTARIDVIMNMPDNWQGSGSPANRVPGRAGGGPVRRGHPYVVGERRPELFVPDEDGTILPSVPPTARGRLPDLLFNLDAAVRADARQAASSPSTGAGDLARRSGAGAAPWAGNAQPRVLVDVHADVHLDGKKVDERIDWRIEVDHEASDQLSRAGEGRWG